MLGLLKLACAELHLHEMLQSLNDFHGTWYILTSVECGIIMHTEKLSGVY